MTITVQDESMRDLVARLWQFEGWRCLWRIPLAAVAFVVPIVLPIVAAVLASWIAGNDFVFRTAVLAALVTALGVSFITPLLARRRWHRRVIADRLWRFEAPNPATEVPVLLRGDDVMAAQRGLRRAKLNPRIYVVRHGIAPADAPDLEHEIKVYEPDAWKRSTSDEDRRDRVVAVLESAGISARAGGVDTKPALPRQGLAEADDGRTTDGASGAVAP